MKKKAWKNTSYRRRRDHIGTFGVALVNAARAAMVPGRTPKAARTILAAAQNYK